MSHFSLYFWINVFKSVKHLYISATEFQGYLCLDLEGKKSLNAIYASFFAMEYQDARKCSSPWIRDQGNMVDMAKSCIPSR